MINHIVSIFSSGILYPYAFMWKNAILKKGSATMTPNSLVGVHRGTGGMEGLRGAGPGWLHFLTTFSGAGKVLTLTVPSKDCQLHKILLAGSVSLD